MSTWVAPYTKPGRVPQTEGYYAVCSTCGNLGVYKDVDGARVAIDGHTCKSAKVERTVCDCDLRVGGCKRKAVHR